MSFSDVLRNDYLDHFDTFGENFDFDTFKNDTFESVCLWPLSLILLLQRKLMQKMEQKYAYLIQIVVFLFEVVWV